MGQLTLSQRRILAAALLGGGGTLCLSHLRQKVQAAQMEQSLLCENLGLDHLMLELGPKGSGASGGRDRRVSVDSIFAARLLRILGICVPSPVSKEAFLIMVQTGLLISRTLLSDRIALLEGGMGQSVVAQNWTAFRQVLLEFAATAIPAAMINSGLKYMQNIVGIAFRHRLTEYLHQRYLSNRAYYAAAVLGGLSNTDQRITEDVERFSAAISELYSYTFKPVLDVLLFTRSLSRSIGYKGQLALYTYFLTCSYILRTISPPLALMTTQEASLSGNFRNAHQRLVANAEEIAYNDPPGGDTERMILNDHLYRLLRHARLSAFQRFWQQAADGFLVKYGATVIGLSVYAVARAYSQQQQQGANLTGDYIRSVRLMTNTAQAIGQLVLLYKRIAGLASFTTRVSCLLESIQQLSTNEGRQRSPYCNDRCTAKVADDPHPDLPPLPRPRMLFGDYIKFDRVTLHAPDGTLLVTSLSFEVREGHSLILMGPNGSGKSSVFRVLAELWPLQSGVVMRPPRGEIFYLSQRPYLVRGTLRDQVRYPAPPRAVAQDLARRYGRSLSVVGTKGTDDATDDARISGILKAVEVGYLLSRGDGLGQRLSRQNWEETLSGGEKQRLAMARLLYHHPKFAVLDECTSAVSADGEQKLYRRLVEAGITCLSIAHRPGLLRFHQAMLVFDGSHSGYGWSYQELRDTET